VEAFGDTYQILVKTQAIQAEGFEDPVFALEEGFGEITATNIPWDSDAPTKGIDLKNALHYLDGDTTTSAISKKITSVTFGLNKNYAEIVGTYEGTLVDVEQDVPVFVYYVPNGSNYDVYALADDVIYAPKDSSNLFKEMQIMATLDTSNLDFGRAELMNSLLYNCFALETLDVTGWDVSNATTFDRLFYTCKKLETITGLGTWDISNVESLFGTFYCCYELSSVGGVENWDTSSVTTMAHAFRCAYDIEELDLNSWDVSNVKEFNSMFSGTTNGNDMALHTLKINQWNTKSAERFNNMFQGCGHLISLDMAGWNVEKLLTTSHMFADCNRLASVDFTGWNTVSLTSMDAMFNDCHAIEVLDVSEFDTANCVEFSQIFEGCRSLERIIGLDQWNTAKANVFDEMFNGASSLKELDLSSFDTSSAKYSNVLQNGEKNYHGYGNMFNGTSSLQKLILGEKFVFAGDGSIPAANYPKFPNPAAKEGLTAMWRNVATGERYLAKDIPEGVAATYVADYEYTAKGAKLVDALHYLNANTGSTKITTKVTSVTFGLTKDYQQIASTYTGVLADQEQKGPVYAYYVPNGSNYDVYVLSDDVIYSPKDSSSLFKGMKALTTVNTTNYRFSGVEKMQEMFAECSALTTLDTTGWDTSKITDMTKLFYKCEVLQAVPGIGGWDMSNVETMFAMFARAYKLKTLDVSNWNTSSVTSLYAMFQMCFELEYLDVADWDVSKVTDFSFLFKGTGNKGDMKINNLDVSKWDTSSAKTFQCMFYGCAQITELDLSTWKTDNLEDTSHMFADCYKLEKISFAGWNTPKLNTIDALFNNCESLKSVDVSDLDTANVVEFSQAFEYCYSLEKIIGLDKWVTTSGQDFGEMFSSCGSLKELDLSSFDTTNAKDSYVNASNGDGNDRFHDFLYGCNALEKIILGKNFSFDGDGSFTKWTFTMPSATKVNGWDGNWYDADGNAYAPSAIPEETAATYYAVKPVNP
jgi:surface protein